MNKQLYLLSMVGFIISPAFCMEVANQEQEVPEIPHEVFENEILLRAFTNLIKECVNSEETDNIKSFLEKVNNLFVNKKATAFLRKYIPARKNTDEKYPPNQTPLLVFAVRTNNLKLCKLILRVSTDHSISEIIDVAMAYATGNNTIENLLLKFGPDQKEVEQFRYYLHIASYDKMYHKNDNIENN